MGEAKHELELLRREAAAHRDRRRAAGRNLRWPEDFKRRVAALLGRGTTVSELSRELVINRRLMGEWRLRYGGEAAEVAGFTELGVVPAATRPRPLPAPSSSSESSIVLEGPRGATVAGLGFRHIAILLQAGLL